MQWKRKVVREQSLVRLAAMTVALDFSGLMQAKPHLEIVFGQRNSLLIWSILSTSKIAPSARSVDWAADFFLHLMVWSKSSNKGPEK